MSSNHWSIVSELFVPQNYEEYCTFMEAHMTKIDGSFLLPWQIEGGFEYLVLVDEAFDSASEMVEFLREEQEPVQNIIESCVSFTERSKSSFARELLGETHCSRVVNGDCSMKKKEEAELIVPNESTNSYAHKMIDEMSEPRILLSESLVHVFDPGIKIFDEMKQVSILGTNSLCTTLSYTPYCSRDSVSMGKISRNLEEIQMATYDVMCYHPFDPGSLVLMFPISDSESNCENPYVCVKICVLNDNEIDQQISASHMFDQMSLKNTPFPWFPFDPGIHSQLCMLMVISLNFKEKWNEIAENVGTKTQAQCNLRFVQRAIEDITGDCEDDAKKTPDMGRWRLDMPNKTLGGGDYGANVLLSLLFWNLLDMLRKHRTWEVWECFVCNQNYKRAELHLSKLHNGRIDGHIDFVLEYSECIIDGLITVKLGILILISIFNKEVAKGKVFYKSKIIHWYMFGFMTSVKVSRNILYAED